MAHFYFAMGDRQAMPKRPICRAFWVAGVYHMGTVALGSLIVAVIVFVKYMVVFLEKRTRWFTGWGWAQKWLKYLVSALVCLLWVLEKIILFINRCVQQRVAHEDSGCGMATQLACTSVTRATAEHGTHAVPPMQECVHHGSRARHRVLRLGSASRQNPRHQLRARRRGRLCRLGAGAPLMPHNYNAPSACSDPLPQMERPVLEAQVFLGKLSVMAASGVIALLMSDLDYYSNPAKYPGTYISSPLLPVLLSMLAGYIVGAMFFNVRGPLLPAILVLNGTLDDPSP